MATRIPIREVVFHPHSFGDQGLRLFRWRGGIYRAVRSDREPLIRELLRADVFQRLCERGVLINTEVTPLRMDGYEMVLRHRLLPFVSYPIEWCAAMLRDAILVMLDLALELARHGYTLGDAHPWNLVVDIDRNCSPVFVDIGSIVPVYSPAWAPYDEFCRYCYYPLLLMSRGEDQIGRLLMWEDSGVSRELVVKLAGATPLRGSAPAESIASRLMAVTRMLFPERHRQTVKRQLNLLTTVLHKPVGPTNQPRDVSDQIRLRSHRRFLEGVRRSVEDVPLPPARPLSSSTDHAARINRVLGRLRPKSVLNVSQDGGACTLLASEAGCDVVAFANDPAVAAGLYDAARVRGLRILPLVMDPTKPTPARGFADHWSIAGTERLQCDMVLAVSLVHRVVAERSLGFDQIAEGLSSLTKRWLLVEFVMDGGNEPALRRPGQGSWYTLDNFRSSLRKIFSNVSAQGDSHGPRVLLLCEK